MFQLDLFQDPRDTELISLRREVREMKSSLDKQRKKLFAENGNQNKEIYEMKQDIELIKRNICRENSIKFKTEDDECQK